LIDFVLGNPAWTSSTKLAAPILALRSSAGRRARAETFSERSHRGVIALTKHLLFVGGEDHHLRIPFMLALAARGFRLTAAGTGNSVPFSRAGLGYRRFAFNRFVNPLADLAAIRSLSKLLSDVQPDLVQSFDTKPNLLVPFAARAAHDMSVVRTINGLGWIYSSRSPLAVALAPVYRTLHRRAARYTDLTVFQNRDDKAFFERHGMLDAGTGRLIAGSGIDVEGFERKAESGPSPADLRETLGLGTSEVVITVTRMTRQKGIPTLLEAAALVHEVRPQVRFLLVGPRQGEGPMAVPQADIDRHAPYVIAVGQRSDVPALLATADVFAFPTEYREGVPRAVLEAALSGLPIVTTQMPGCSDVIRDGWNGYLVPTRSPSDLAARIIDLLSDRQTARLMGQRAAALVRREFNLEITVERYVALYQELMASRVRRAGRDNRYEVNMPAGNAMKSAASGEPPLAKEL
jgi:glycosyltransferase involved in cell wall biosynthesis